MEREQRICLSPGLATSDADGIRKNRRPKQPTMSERQSGKVNELLDLVVDTYKTTMVPALAAELRARDAGV
jgi:hypothetical protein